MIEVSFRDRPHLSKRKNNFWAFGPTPCHRHCHRQHHCISTMMPRCSSKCWKNCWQLLSPPPNTHPQACAHHVSLPLPASPVHLSSIWITAGCQSHLFYTWKYLELWTTKAHAHMPSRTRMWERQHKWKPLCLDVRASFCWSGIEEEPMRAADTCDDVLYGELLQKYKLFVGCADIFAPLAEVIYEK